MVMVRICDESLDYLSQVRDGGWGALPGGAIPSYKFGLPGERAEVIQ